MLLLYTPSIFGQTTKSHNTTTESTMVRISDSDYDYSVIAEFANPRSKEIKSLITQRLGGPGRDTLNTTIWSQGNAYMIKLRPNKLNIELDKDIATGKQTKQITQLGQDIQRMVTTTQNPIGKHEF